MIGELFAAGTSLLTLRDTSSETTRSLLVWLLGGSLGTAWNDLPLPLVVVVAALVAGLASARSLDGLALGDDTAGTLGFDAHAARLRLLVVSALTTAVLVAYCGAIGFVGLLVPHAARFAVGGTRSVARTRRVLLVSALAGAVLMVWVDTLARTAFAPEEIPWSAGWSRRSSAPPSSSSSCGATAGATDEHAALGHGPQLGGERDAGARPRRARGRARGRLRDPGAERVGQDDAAPAARPGAEPHAGSVSIGGDDAARLGRRERSRRLAVLVQDQPAELELTTMDLVLIGRSPHKRRLEPDTPEDVRIARRGARGRRRRRARGHAG